MDHVCYACGAHHASGARCDCGEPLWLAGDPPDFDWSDAADGPGMWRYAPLLPTTSPGGVADAAGGTPCFRAPSLDEYAGVRVHVKDEGEHPTGSFKDRGSALGVAVAAREGAPVVGTVSHGNMAMSTAAHAASAGLDCVVCVPADVPDERLSLIGRFDPTLLRVEGDYGRLYDLSLEAGADLGVPFLNSDVPLRVEGQKTTALEILEAFAVGPAGRDGGDAAPVVPDAIVLPLSSGGHLSGVWKALRELREAGTVDRVPRIYGVQAAACAPVAEAFAAGRDAVRPLPDGGDETVAYSIANADPPSGTRALAAVRETDGGVVAVGDEAILDARRAFAARAGLSVETASATTLAGARQLAASGELAPDDHAVLVATGSGFKERGVDPAEPDAETVDIEDVAGRLGELVDSTGPE